MWVRKIKKLTRDVWKGEYYVSVSSGCRKLWDVLIGGEMFLGLVGYHPTGSDTGILFILGLHWVIFL